jgi:TonB-linked SusC/RagA family outer membrane protein
MRRLLMVAVATLFVFVQVFAQTTVTVSGKVTDEKGASIAGATILEKGTRNATTSHDDGTFTLSVKNRARLVISYVGYENIEVEAREGLKITLNPESKTLSDVVVTGVGVATSRKKLPIDIATVSSKDFAKSATTSVQQALDGQVAGAQVQQTSGRAGANYLITLRGINSLDGTNPLIMVDGVQMNSNNLSSLDPSTVDHIEVVKGAAGGMLYGAQGANGIIQIFTKKGGQNQRLGINFSSKVSVDNILRGKDILSHHHYYVTDANNNILDAGNNPIARNAIGVWSDPSPPILTSAPLTENNKTYNLPTYDHLKQAYRQALTFNNSINLTGGNAYTDYSFTASVLNQQDVLSNAYTRSNIGLNLGIQPFKGFTFRSITQAIIGNNNLTNGNRFDIITGFPYVDYTWKDSTGHIPLKTSNASNQLNTLSEKQYHQLNSSTFEIFQNFDFNYKFPRFVELDFKYGLDFNVIDGKSEFVNQSAALIPNLHWGPDRLGDITNTYTRNYLVNALTTAYIRFDFEKDFHSSLPIRATTQLSYDYRDNATRQYFAEGTQLPPYPPANISSAAVKNDGDFYSEFVTFGVLANETIDYANLFGISVGVRSDYGSPFGAASEAETFPRGTVYFRPSELMGGKNWLGDWKLRAAFGKAGVLPNAYDRQVTLSQVTLGSGVSLSLPSQATNDSLRLAVSSEMEVGTDITFLPFHDKWLPRLALSGTYWNREGRDLYQYANVAPSAGYASKLDNLATIQAHGLDLTLDATMYNSSNVVWNMSVRWGFTRSVLTKAYGGKDIVVGQFASKQGQPLGLFYTQTAVRSLTQLQPDGKTPYIPPANQQYYVVASTGNVVDTRTNIPLLTLGSDLSVVGHEFPDFNSSIINSVTLYRNLTISFQFDWTHGNSIYNETKQWLYRPAGGSGGTGGISSDLDKKLTIGTHTGAFVNYYQGLYNVGSPEAQFVEDGSFIRLKDLSVTYDLKNVVKVNSIRRLSVTFSGRNLLTFTKYSGLDPENTGPFDTQGNNLANARVGAFTGVDYFGVPNLRSYQFSLNVGL